MDSFIHYWPQVTVILLWVINLIVVSVKDGTPRGNYNSRTAFVDLMITAWLLYEGGFFK